MRDSSTDSEAARLLLDRAKRDVLGQDIAAIGASGFLSPSEPDQIARCLYPFRPDHLIDAGCGNGALGTLIAGHVGCTIYSGFDADPRAIALARDRRYDGSPLVRRFATGRFEDPVEAKADALLSHDALYLAENLAAAVRGVVARVQPGGVVVLTAYVGATVQEGGIGGRTPRHWRAALATAGCDPVKVTDVSPAWRKWGTKLHRRRLELCAALPENGAIIRQIASISRRMLGLDGRAAFLSSARRIRIVATVGKAPLMVPVALN